MSFWDRVPGTAAWRRRRDMVVCARTGERLQEIVDGEIELTRATRVLLNHLAACERCGAAAAQLRELKAAIARVTHDETDDLARRLEGAARQMVEPPEA